MLDPESLHVLLEKAQQGDVDAQYTLGQRYFQGVNLTQDYALAYSWMKKAAAQHHTEAQYHLGLFYHFGMGVIQNYDSAREWYEKAAAQNCLRAQISLGILYTLGLGVPQNSIIAQQWFKKAKGSWIVAKLSENDREATLKLLNTLSGFIIAVFVGQMAIQTPLHLFITVIENHPKIQDWFRRVRTDGATARQIFQVFQDMSPVLILALKKPLIISLASSFASSFLVALVFLTKDIFELDLLSDGMVQWQLKVAEHTAESQYNSALFTRNIAKRIFSWLLYEPKYLPFWKIIFQKIIVVWEEIFQKNIANAHKLFEEAAAQDHAGAQYHLGLLYHHGFGVTQNYRTACQWYEKAAKQNHTEAQYNLGLFYHHGLGVVQNYMTARQWYEKAAEKNHPKAQYNLGTFYHYGRGVVQDYTVAHQWYENAAKQQDGTAQYRLGWIYFHGLGVGHEYLKAREWFEKAMVNHCAEGSFGLGLLYENGYGVTRRYAKAFALYEKAASENNPYAQCRLGRLYYYGYGVKRNPNKADELFKQAAAQLIKEPDNIDNAYYLGMMHEHGYGIPQDYHKACEWYEKAAAKNFPDAKNSLGRLYEQGGYGIEKDCVQAFGWYEKAAADNLPDALFNLGRLYEQGDGVIQSYAKAREYYEKAALQDHANAQFNLALLYHHGYGIPKNPIKAREWLEKAAAQGHTGAARLLSTAHTLFKAAQQLSTSQFTSPNNVGAIIGGGALLLFGARYLWDQWKNSNKLSVEEISLLRKQISLGLTSSQTADNFAFLNRLSPETKQYLESLNFDERKELDARLQDLIKQQENLKLQLDPLLRKQQADTKLQQAIEEINQNPEIKLYFEALLKIMDQTLLASLVISSGKVAQASGLGAKLLEGATKVAGLCFPGVAPFLSLAQEIMSGLGENSGFRDMRKLSQWVAISSDIPQLSLALAVACTKSQADTLRAGHAHQQSQQSLLTTLKNKCHLLFEQIKTGENFTPSQEHAVLDAYALLKYMMCTNPEKTLQINKINQLVKHLTGKECLALETYDTTHPSVTSSAGLMLIQQQLQSLELRFQGIASSGTIVQVQTQEIEQLKKLLADQRTQIQQLTQSQARNTQYQTEQNTRGNLLKNGVYNEQGQGSLLQVSAHDFTGFNLPQGASSTNLLINIQRQLQEFETRIQTLEQTSDGLQSSQVQHAREQERLYLKQERQQRQLQQQSINQQTLQHLTDGNFQRQDLQQPSQQPLTPNKKSWCKLQ